MPYLLPMPYITRFALIRLVPLLCCVLASGTAAAQDSPWQALRQGGVVLFRHANAPGTGDPPGFRLSDCTTQRNLDAAGRAQARRIGAAFVAEAVTVDAVLASRWCRATETAELAFPGRVRAEPSFDSFFDERRQEPERTAAARRLLSAWQGPGALVVVTHQVNITALTGVVPASGEGVVLTRRGDDWEVAGRIKP